MHKKYLPTLFIGTLFLFLSCGPLYHEEKAPKNNLETLKVLDTPPLDPLILEKLNKLPSLAISFDKAFENPQDLQTLWGFTVDARNSFYGKNLKVFKFYISNFSNKDIEIRFKEPDLKILLTQHLNKFVLEGPPNDLSKWKSINYWMIRNISLINYSFISFLDKNQKEVELLNHYKLSSGEILAGYLSVDFSAIPKCPMPSIKSIDQNGLIIPEGKQKDIKLDQWMRSEFFSLLRVTMDFNINLSLEKSLPNETFDFYSRKEAWIQDQTVGHEPPQLKSDQMLPQLGSAYDFNMNTPDFHATEMPIEDFSCQGLY